VPIKAVFFLKVKNWDCYIYLTPLFPLSFEGEGEINKKRGFAPLRHLLGRASPPKRGVGEGHRPTIE